jgi:hypothetical protein
VAWRTVRSRMESPGDHGRHSLDRHYDANAAPVFAVMPGTRAQPSAGPGVNLVAGHPRLCVISTKQDVDGRDKPGHDEYPRRCALF